MTQYWNKTALISGLVLRGTFLWLILFASSSAGVELSNVPIQWPWHGVTVSYPSGKPSDIRRFKSQLNINMVRLQVRINQYAIIKKTTGPEAFAESVRWLDEMLDECSRLGITAVINYGQFPIGDKGDSMKSPVYWADKKNLDEVVFVSAQLATHFRKRGEELAGYDIISEPLEIVNGKPSIPSNWPGLMNRIVATINNIDPNRWIVVAPGIGGGPAGYGGFMYPKGTKVIFGLHMYLPHSFTHQGIDNRAVGLKYPGQIGMSYWDKDALRKKLAPLVRLQEDFSAPVFVGEFSAVRWADGGEQYLMDLVSIFDAYGWGWAYYSASGWHGWNPDYNNIYGVGVQVKNQIVEYGSLRWKTLRAFFKTEEKYLNE